MLKGSTIIFTSLFLFCQIRLFIRSNNKSNKSRNKIDYDEIEKIAKENNELLKKLINEIDIKQS